MSTHITTDAVQDTGGTIRGQRFFSSVPNGVFNLLSSFTELEDFGRLHGVLQWSWRYRFAGGRFGVRIPSMPLNLTAGFLVPAEFARFQEAIYTSNARCREHWPELARELHRAGPSLFGRFDSKELLCWVLFKKGIDARGWELRLPVSPRHNDVQPHSILYCLSEDLDQVRVMVEKTQVEIDHKVGICASRGVTRR